MCSNKAEQKVMEAAPPEVQHAEPRAFERIKKLTRGHGEQTVLPDDCQFGDNDLCYVDAWREVRLKEVGLKRREWEGVSMPI